MDFTLPTDYDVIIIGTGFVESLLSAALSRVGKQVLQVDSKDYYGGHWASFNLENINKISTTCELVEPIDKTHCEQSDTFLSINNENSGLKDVEQNWHVEKTLKKINVNAEGDVSQNAEEGATKEQTEQLIDNEQESWTEDSLMKNSRRFNIDLSPKLHFARGDFVELMISANLSRYSEFRSVSRVLTWLNGNLESVPCSRSDVFSNDKVSVIEKRMLMKLLVACVDNDTKEFVGYENKTFYTYLKDHKLTDNLIHYVLYTIAMSTKDTSCIEGVENTKRFLQSLGRFGKTPLLYAMYGSGDISQAFCRCSAVFGGIFALNQNLKGIIVDKDNNFKSVICGEQKLNAKYLILGTENAPSDYVKHIEPSYISRATFITDRSIWETEKEHLTLLVFPPENNKNTCITIEMGSLTGTCPKKTHLIHMIAKQTTTPKEDFSECIEKLFNRNDSPKILWSTYYSIPNTNNCDLKKNIPSNIIICPGPDLDLDYDNSIKKARNIFEEMYPGEPFFPRVPDPEEIIFAGEDDENKTNETTDLINESNQEETERIESKQTEENPSDSS